MTAVVYTLQFGPLPAPSDVLAAVQEIEVEAAIEEASAFRLRLCIAQTAAGDWTVLEHNLFRPLTPMTIRLQVGTGVPEALINGYVSDLQVTYADAPGQSVAEVTGLDATLLMNLREVARPWTNVSDSTIATLVFTEYGLAPRVEPTMPSLVEPEGTTLQRGSDIRFLRRLAQRNGFDCYVQPEPLTGVDVGYFQPPQLVGPPQAVLSVNMGLATNVCDFKIHYEMLRPTAAEGAVLDTATKAPQPALAPVAAERTLGVEGTLLRVVPPPSAHVIETGLSHAADVQRATQAAVDRSTWAIVAEGQVGPEVGILRPGGIVNVRGAGSAFNGSYYLTRVAHTIGPDRYSQRFTARRNAVGMTGAELYVALEGGS